MSGESEIKVSFPLFTFHFWPPFSVGPSGLCRQGRRHGSTACRPFGPGRFLWLSFSCDQAGGFTLALDQAADSSELHPGDYLGPFTFRKLKHEILQGNGLDCVLPVRGGA